MAINFTGDEKASLGEILEVNHDELADHISYLDSLSVPVPAEVQAKVSTDIVLWESYRDKHIRTVANVKNFGADRDQERNREAIRERVSKHLLFNRHDTGGSTILVRA